ncbi:MAG: ATP-binding protein [Phascolarctobacterium sp.]|nr:ATP-binding protein [Phascolarctobacterium sp.]
MYIERSIKNTIKSVNSTFSVLCLTGPRQIGKTTLLENLADKKRTIISLDNTKARNLAQTDPELFLQRYTPPVLIDEVQYAPELFPYIKLLVDKRQHTGDFWLTGSQMFSLMKNVSETMAGRVALIPLQGFSNSELQGFNWGEFTFDRKKLLTRMKKAKPLNIRQIFDKIFKGSMPRPNTVRNLNLEVFFESYINTYLARDLYNQNNIADELSFLNFLKIVAARTATNVNYDVLAREAEISTPTAKRWLSILVASGLVIIIPSYTKNVIKRVIKSPRMYMTDTGLCSYLMGWGTAKVLENSSMSGAFFETWVVNEIYKSYLNVGKRPPLYFYRDSNQDEIDLIIEEGNLIHPIEIKKSANPKNPCRHFKTLPQPLGTGAVICMTDDIIPVDKSNNLIPAWLI